VLPVAGWPPELAMTLKNSSPMHTWLTVSWVDLAHVPRLLLQNKHTWQYSHELPPSTAVVHAPPSMKMSRHPAWSVQDSMPFCRTPELRLRASGKTCEFRPATMCNNAASRMPYCDLLEGHAWACQATEQLSCIPCYTAHGDYWEITGQ